MKNFIMFFDEKEGSSAIMETLNKYWQVSTIGYEPFDRYMFTQSGKGKDMPMQDITRCLDYIYSDTGLGPNQDELNKVYSKYNNNKKHLNALKFNHKKANGLKMRLHHNRWGHRQMVYDILKKNDVVALVMFREDVLKWALSRYKQGHLQFKLANGEIKKSEVGLEHYDIEKLNETIENCYNSYHKKFKIIDELTAQGIKAVPVFYESFMYNKYNFIKNTLQHIKIKAKNEQLLEVISANTYFKKVHGDKIEDIAANHQEIKANFGHLLRSSDIPSPKKHIIIYSNERSGTSWLLDLIAASEDVQSFGELFHKKNNNSSYLEEESIKLSGVDHAIAVVDFNAFKSHQPHSVIDGISIEDKLSIFKIFKGHLSWPDVVKTILRDDIIPIYLERNFIDIYISKKKALKVKSWENTDTSNVKIDFDITDFMKDYNSHIKWMHLLESSFAKSNSPVLHLKYEEIINNTPAEVLLKVNTFINEIGQKNLQLTVPENSLIKQDKSKALSESISNFDEMVEQLTKFGLEDLLQTSMKTIS